MFLAHKIELRPTAEQVEFLERSAGCRRFVYNVCLAEWNDAYKRGFKPDKIYMLFFYKCLREKYSWLRDVSMNSVRLAIDDLADGWKRFYKNHRNGNVAKKIAKLKSEGKKINHLPFAPRFIKKGIKDRFALRDPVRFKVNGRFLKIEKLKTFIKMRQDVRFDGKCKHVTISKIAGKWFASILVNVSANPFSNKIPSENQVGIDLGVRKMAVLSDGKVFGSSQKLKYQLKRLKKLQKKLSKKRLVLKKLGLDYRKSKRYQKLKLRIAKLHHYVKCKRLAIAHEFTDFVTKNYKFINIEDLNVSGMLKNHKLARTIQDVGFFEIRRQLEYKAKLRGCEVKFVNRFFPSSKICSNCGEKNNNLGFSEEFNCPLCNLQIDRDLNAAINMANY